MNLNDYEKKYFSTYAAFAETVRFILEKALLAADNLPRPQSVQCRVKGIESLRRRLAEEGKLDTQMLELDRRDLAGARLIFYTNNDVERFLASPLIRENFEIEEDSTRIHHPTPENKGARYRAIHYTVRLREDRIRLPEYARFAGLRCEIQVQTILNHAWSETSHDILYKDKLGDGYGGKAMKGIARRFERISGDAQKRAVLSALDAATRTPIQAQYPNELLATALKDAARIVEFVTERAEAASYELLQHLEHQFLHDYFWAKSLTDDLENRFGCQDEAAALVAAICKFRDIINADDRFVRYKVLVGFESVYLGHWTNKEFDYQGADEYRRCEANRYIDEINAANEHDWFDLIARCAETKSNDLATFPVFGNFISTLAERMPEVADRFLAKASGDLRSFLAGFLNGLALSGRRNIYERILESELESARNLAGVARHLRYSEMKKPDFAARLLNRAIDKGDTIAVIECLLFALEHYGTEKIADADTFLCDALTFLNDRKDPRWVSGAWFLQKATKFYEELTPERTAQVLQNLGYLRKVNYQVERVLVRLAERQPEAVWDYFGARLAREAAESEDGECFEAVPFRFHGLEKELSKDPQLAISKGLYWFAQDRKLFQFRGGRLLSSAFPNYTLEFAAALAELVKSGGDTEADFALAILQNYRGETSTHDILKEIVSWFPDDASKMSRVRISINSTGVVRGELGFAEAWRVKKESLTEWLADERPVVKAFAEKHIAELDLMIASEQRRAEAEREMRNRSYDEEDDESDHNDSDGGESAG